MEIIQILSQSGKGEWDTLNLAKIQVYETIIYCLDWNPETF